MMLSGNLTDWSVGDLMQMLHITKKTASLHVEGTDRYGVVHFEDGAIVNADVSLGGGAAREPKDEVIEALYVLELLDEGTFAIKSEVPARMVDPISVSEALELAGRHLAQERQLDETGLLAARALRLALSIDEPIILSEQVWNAISGSIPAFTFPELEERLGRAAAIATVEQFRDLGILEAVLEEPEPTEAVAPAPIEQAVPLEAPELVPAEPTTELEPAHAMVVEPVDVHDDETADLGWGTRAFDDPEPVESTQPDLAVSEVPEDGRIIPENVEEIRPIITDAPDDELVIAGGDELQSTSEPAPEPAIGSLSAAIRAAAGPSAADDAAALRDVAAEVEGATSPSPHAEDESLRRTVRSLVSEPKSPLSNGMLGDLGARIRQAAAVDRDD